ncbi:PEP-CTERM sorting domain-containing protein [Bradyrhizobium sp.]|uniref:PEP-CTERM sorting domain-containing protein n=1 Tax=Bradyrhizobium sp. TaxID=376 RepID=UPI000A07A462
MRQQFSDRRRCWAAVPAVPEPSTWAMMILGFVGMRPAQVERDRAPRSSGVIVSS